MADGVEVQEQVVPGAHVRLCRASTASKVARVTSTSSSKGIGDGRPSAMADTKAATQASLPLSCRQRFILVKPGQP